MAKVDAHAHIGEDTARKYLSLPYNCDAELLFHLAQKNNISDIIASPPPGQIVCPNLGGSNHPNFYGLKGIPSCINYEDKMEFLCNCGTSWKTEDPFSNANNDLFRTVKELNKRSRVKFHPVPIVHPLKSNVSRDVRRYHKEYDIKGVKIHSLIDKTDPRGYKNSELVDILKDLNLRILFHTDNIEHCLPKNIIEFAETTKLSCQLAHACWGDRESLNKVSNLNNVIVDISPLNISQDKERLLTNTRFKSHKSFIKYIVDCASIENTVAASDYFWCGWTVESYNKQWEEFDKFGDEKVLYKNAKDFWNIS